jgi:hypothetical protein
MYLVSLIKGAVRTELGMKKKGLGIDSRQSFTILLAMSLGGLCLRYLKGFFQITLYIWTAQPTSTAHCLRSLFGFQTVFDVFSSLRPV